MTFFVTLIALMLERFYDWSNARKWSWYKRYQRAINQRLISKPVSFQLITTVLPVIFAFSIFNMVFSGWLFGFVAFTFQLMVLLYCFGPSNLWADTFVSINSLNQHDAQLAADNLKLTFGVKDASSTEALHKNFLSKIFIEANRRIFAVTFWFILFGPVGAVMYRAIAISANPSTNDQSTAAFLKCANAVLAVLDWAPVRILTFIFALGGHFTKVFAYWRKKVTQGFASNEMLITECGAAALGEEQATIAIDGSAQKSAIALLDRAFVITLIMIAMVTFWI